MNGVVIAALYGVTLMGGLWPFGGDKDAQETTGTIGQLEERPIELKKEVVVPGGAAAAREQYRKFLEISKDNPQLQMEATRRLGDLNLTAGQDEEIDVSAESAAIYYAEAIQLYTTLLESNPDYADADKILYQLASVYEATGQPGLALKTLDRLVRDYPDSLYFDEAQFRRGETLFVARDYPAAEAAYAAVVAYGPDSAFYEQSLYKHGWTLFKRGRHEESLDSFMDLLDATLGGERAPDADLAMERMSRPERELLDDAFRVLAISFSYLDGYVSLNELMDRRGRTAYDHLLYVGLGDLYLSQERYQDAAQTYAAFVARQPVNDHSPALQERVIEAYTRAKFPSLVLEAKENYVELYGLDTAFWPNRFVMDWSDVIDQLKLHLTDLANYDHAKAQAEDDTAAYQRAANWYRRYIAYFPDDPESGQLNFLLAQVLFDLGRYGESSEEFERTAYGYGAHENAADAGYAAIMAANKHAESLTGEALVEWRLRSLDDALQFAQTFSAHEQAAPVLTNVAEEFFRGGDLDRAIETAGLVVTLQPPAPMELERTAWTVIAHANFDLEEYATAEQAYQRLLQMPLAADTDGEEFQQRIAASIYRQGEQAQVFGNVDLAVAEYLRLAAAQPQSDFVPNAIFDAGALLIVNRRWGEAIDVLERFRRDFPGHEFTNDVTQKLAFAYQSDGQAGRAAAEYERIAHFPDTDPELHREVLWQAADLYEQQGAVGDQMRIYREIVERFPEPFDESLEARQKLADLAKETDDWAERQKWLNAIVVADAAAGPSRSARSQTLAAEAKLELAGPQRDAFLAVKLTIPLKASLKLKKERMEVALQSYGQAADYGIASVTTAATYEIADLYYGLSKDLLDSQRPAELNEEELEQYEILLEEQAFPFEEQAIDIFKTNSARARDGVYDQWVRRSFARLAELMPARYAKSERSENVVIAID